MTLSKLPEFEGGDDSLQPIRRDDYSGGENTRMHASKILPNQGKTIENWDIGVPGQLRKIPGLTLIENLSANPGVGLFGFDPDGGTPVLVAIHGQKLETWPGSGTFTERSTTLTDNLATGIIKCGESGIGDVFLASNETDNVLRYDPADYSTPQDLGDTNMSPPKTKVMCYFRNRVWTLKENLAAFSTAYPADYSAAFDRTTNVFRVPVGAARALVPIRDTGILMFGKDQVWALNPSVVPAATDLPEKILDIGCVAGSTCVQVNDDVWFLASDGLRGVFRTQQDKVQMGQSFPLSYLLKTRFENINWACIEKACGIFWDNKYFLALPTGAATYNNEVWVFYPAQQVNVGNNIVVPAAMVITGWNVAQWAVLALNGKKNLYAVDSTDGIVYQAWEGYSNNGEAIVATLTGREENFDQPLNYKVSGDIEVEAQAAGSGYTLSISVALDGGSFTSLGNMDLTSGSAPVLPLNLPFSLADTFIVRDKYHLDSLGRYRTLQPQIVNSDINTEEIIMYGINMTTLVEEYESE